MPGFRRVSSYVRHSENNTKMGKTKSILNYCVLRLQRIYIFYDEKRTVEPFKNAREIREKIFRCSSKKKRVIIVILILFTLLVVHTLYIIEDFFK